MTPLVSAPSLQISALILYFHLLSRCQCSCLFCNLNSLIGPRKGTDFQNVQLFSHDKGRADNIQVFSMFKFILEFSPE